MKTNITDLMNQISTEEKKLTELSNYLSSSVYSETTEELNGRKNVISDIKEEYQNKLKEYSSLSSKISKMKCTLYNKNNMFKLSDGRTIQEALTENSILRNELSLYSNIILFSNKKTRITEVNNSYFLCCEINYNKKDLEKKIKQIEEKIQKTDFEISKLNSVEFDI